ncbi:MAG TPA: hypothetical protein VD788_00845 [Candidatus Polarisedimenticolaceae bacterium]|nr:hypothetical protein [Candidatus Polarisedimenticolaceae bacterium]
MRKIKATLVTAMLLAGSTAAFAQPEVPDTPTDPSGIEGFVMALLENVRAFVEGLIGTLPV